MRSSRSSPSIDDADAAAGGGLSPLLLPVSAGFGMLIEGVGQYRLWLLIK